MTLTKKIHADGTRGHCPRQSKYGGSHVVQTSQHTLAAGRDGPETSKSKQQGESNITKFCEYLAFTSQLSTVHHTS